MSLLCIEKQLQKYMNVLPTSWSKLVLCSGWFASGKVCSLQDQHLMPGLWSYHLPSLHVVLLVYSNWFIFSVYKWTQLLLFHYVQWHHQRPICCKQSSSLFLSVKSEIFKRLEGLKFVNFLGAAPLAPTPGGLTALPSPDPQLFHSDAARTRRQQFMLSMFTHVPCPPPPHSHHSLRPCMYLV